MVTKAEIDEQYAMLANVRKKLKEVEPVANSSAEIIRSTERLVDRVSSRAEDGKTDAEIWRRFSDWGDAVTRDAIDCAMIARRCRSLEGQIQQHISELEREYKRQRSRRIGHMMQTVGLVCGLSVVVVFCLVYFAGINAGWTWKLLLGLSVTCLAGVHIGHWIAK